MIDHKELRRLALCATPGPWSACGDHRGGCSCGQVWSTTVDFPVATAFKGDPEVGFAPEGKQQANALYIAAASPSVVLALLDEVEARQWISLAERKPPEWRHVIVALDSGTVVIGVRGSMGWHWDETDNPADLEASATHWMPFPSAPAMQAKEEGK